MYLYIHTCIYMYIIHVHVCVNSAFVCMCVNNCVVYICITGPLCLVGYACMGVSMTACVIDTSSNSIHSGS